MSAWYCDGESINALSIDDRAIQYGDGLFETIAIRGGEPRLWQLHVERLHHGCERLAIAVPTEESLRAHVQQAIQESGIDSDYALAKIIVTAGSGPRGYKRTDSGQSRVLIAVYDLQQPGHAAYRDGVEVVRCATTLAAQPALAGIKTLNRLEQILARNEWQDPDVFDGLMCDSAERLICGTMSNVFVVRDQSISTPDLGRCGVAGVMRRHVLDTLLGAGKSAPEEDIHWDDAMAANEVFLTNSQFGVMPVRQCGEQHWSVGPITRELMKRVAHSGIEECAS